MLFFFGRRDRFELALAGAFEVLPPEIGALETVQAFYPTHELAFASLGRNDK